MSPKKFKTIRMELGLTQEETALILGLADKTVVNRYEAGSRQPSKLTMAIMDILSVLPKKKASELIELLRTHVEKAGRELDA